MNGKGVLTIAMMTVITGVLVLYAYQLSTEPTTMETMSPTLMFAVVVIFALFLTLIFYAPKIKRGMRLR